MRHVRRWLGALTSIACVVVAALVGRSWWLDTYYAPTDTVAERAALAGDAMAPWVGILTLLAVGAAFLSVWLQNKEMRESRAEMALQTEALLMQNEIAARANELRSIELWREVDQHMYRTGVAIEKAQTRLAELSSILDVDVDDSDALSERLDEWSRSRGVVVLDDSTQHRVSEIASEYPEVDRELRKLWRDWHELEILSSLLWSRRNSAREQAEVMERRRSAPTAGVHTAISRGPPLSVDQIRPARVQPAKDAGDGDLRRGPGSA